MTIPGPPPALAWITLILAGQSWPPQDEDKLRQVGEVWETFGKNIKPLADQLVVAEHNIRQAGHGPAIDEAISHLKALNDGAKSLLPVLDGMIGDLKKSTADFSRDVQAAKMTIIAMSAYVMFLLAKMAVLKIMTWGAAAPAADAAAAIVIRTLQQQIARMLIRLAVKAGITGLVMAGLNLAIQEFQVLVLHTRSPQDVDAGEIAKGAGLAALGAATEWMLGPLRFLPGGKSIGVTIFKNMMGNFVPVMVDPDSRTGEGIAGAFLSGAFMGGIHHKTKEYAKLDHPNFSLDTFIDKLIDLWKDRGSNGGGVDGFGSDKSGFSEKKGGPPPGGENPDFPEPPPPYHELSHEPTNGAEPNPNPHPTETANPNAANAPVAGQPVEQTHPAREDDPLGPLTRPENNFLFGPAPELAPHSGNGVTDVAGQSHHVNPVTGEFDTKTSNGLGKSSETQVPGTNGANGAPNGNANGAHSGNANGSHTGNANGAHNGNANGAHSGSGDVRTPTDGAPGTHSPTAGDLIHDHAGKPPETHVPPPFADRPPPFTLHPSGEVPAWEHSPAAVLLPAPGDGGLALIHTPAGVVVVEGVAGGPTMGSVTAAEGLHTPVDSKAMTLVQGPTTSPKLFDSYVTSIKSDLRTGGSMMADVGGRELTPASAKALADKFGMPVVVDRNALNGPVPRDATPLRADGTPTTVPYAEKVLFRPDKTSDGNDITVHAKPLEPIKVKSMSADEPNGSAGNGRSAPTIDPEIVKPTSASTATHANGANGSNGSNGHATGTGRPEQAHSHDLPPQRSSIPPPHESSTSSHESSRPPSVHDDPGQTHDSSTRPAPEPYSRGKEVWHFTDDPRQISLGEKAPKVPGWLTITVGPVEDSKVWIHGEQVDAAGFAEILKAQPDWAGQNLTIIGDFAGRGGADSFAGQVGHHLGVDAVASRFMVDEQNNKVVSGEAAKFVLLKTDGTVESLHHSLVASLHGLEKRPPVDPVPTSDGKGGLHFGDTGVKDTATEWPKIKGWKFVTGPKVEFVNDGKTIHKVVYLGGKEYNAAQFAEHLRENRAGWTAATSSWPCRTRRPAAPTRSRQGSRNTSTWSPSGWTRGRAWGSTATSSPVVWAPGGSSRPRAARWNCRTTSPTACTTSAWTRIRRRPWRSPSAMPAAGCTSRRTTSARSWYRPCVTLRTRRTGRSCRRRRRPRPGSGSAAGRTARRSSTST